MYFFDSQNALAVSVYVILIDVACLQYYVSDGLFYPLLYAGNIANMQVWLVFAVLFYTSKRPKLADFSLMIIALGSSILLGKVATDIALYATSSYGPNLSLIFDMRFFNSLALTLQGVVLYLRKARLVRPTYAVIILLLIWYAVLNIYILTTSDTLVPYLSSLGVIIAAVFIMLSMLDDEMRAAAFRGRASSGRRGPCSQSHYIGNGVTSLHSGRVITRVLLQRR